MQDAPLTLRVGSRVVNINQSDIARFWSFVPDRGDGCWLWSGHRGTKGYGTLWLSAFPVRAHRVSYTIHYGPIPDGALVCHHCDCPPCCNPSHLFLGSGSDNVQDMLQKQRHQYGDAHYSRREPERLARGDRHGSKQHPERIKRGEDQHLARLTAASVLFARKLHATGATFTEVAKRLGVNRTTIASIIHGKTWRHV